MTDCGFCCAPGGGAPEASVWLPHLQARLQSPRRCRVSRVPSALAKDTRPPGGREASQAFSNSSHLSLFPIFSPEKSLLSPLSSQTSQSRRSPFLCSYFLPSTFFFSFSLIHSLLRNSKRAVILKMIARDKSKCNDEYKSTLALGDSSRSL